MSAIAREILTPTDLEPFLYSHGFTINPFVSNMLPSLEPIYREKIDACFSDLECILGDRDLIKSWLNSFSECLKELHSLSCSVFAMRTKGRYTISALGEKKSIDDWDVVHLYLVPSGCYFGSKGTNQIIHRFSRCDQR